MSTMKNVFVWMTEITAVAGMKALEAICYTLATDTKRLPVLRNHARQAQITAMCNIAIHVAGIVITEMHTASTDKYTLVVQALYAGILRRIGADYTIRTATARLPSLLALSFMFYIFRVTLIVAVIVFHQIVVQTQSR